MLHKLFIKKSNEPRKKYGGIIIALELEEYWDSLLPEERQFIKECYASSNGVNPDNLDSPRSKIAYTSQSVSGFLSNYAGWAISKKRFELADKLLNESVKRNKNVVDLHFTYNYLINLCYKRRNEGPDWIEVCIKYCIEDIKIFPEFKYDYLKQERERLLKHADSPLFNKKERANVLKRANNVSFNLRISSFQQLAIIYEKQGRYKEAIEICNLAKSYELIDTTKGGFDSRIERLKKKLEVKILNRESDHNGVN